MQHYWIWGYEYPGPAARLAELNEEVRGLNPKMLHGTEIEGPVIMHILEAVVADEIDEDEFRRKGTEVLEWLIGYAGTQELHILLAHLIVRSPLAFGGVEIHPIPNTGDTTEYQLKYEGPFRLDADPIYSFAVVPHAPGLGFKAWLNAVEAVEEVLTIIRAVGLPTLWGRDLHQAGILGRGFASGWAILRERHRSQWDMSMATSPPFALMKLEGLMRNYTGHEIDTVERIYLSERPSKMERKVLQALFWLGEATYPASISSKFARLAIALETAIGGEAGRAEQLREIGIAQMLAERAAFLLGGDRDSRLAWHRAVTELYGLRSRLMHGETSPISDDELTRWAYLVWSAIRAVLNRVSDFQTVEGFAAWVRSQRYTLPEEA